MRRVEIIPAIIPEDLDHTKQVIRDVQSFSPLVQLDIGDGVFSKTSTLKARDLSLDVLRGLEVEVHLMVYAPDDEVMSWIRLGAKRIIVHAEAKPSAQLLQTIRDSGIEPFIGLTAGSDASLIDPYLHLVSGVLFLSISPPGMQGQPFLPDTLKKIRDFHDMHPGYILEADGGISEHTMKDVVKAGATRLVMGSALLHADRPASEQYARLTRMLENAM